MQCSVTGCTRSNVIIKAGLCRAHYEHLRQYGTTDSVPRRRRPAIDRFLPKFEVSSTPPAHRPDLDPCWLWTGATQNGYGVFEVWPKAVKAHRWAYEHYVGPVPNGLQLDHLCRVRHCVNPRHLEPVTAAMNVQRAVAVRPTRETCSEGHEFTPENTYVSTRGHRQCRTCARAWDRTRKARQRQRRKATDADSG